MGDVKLVITHLTSYFLISKDQSPKTEEEIEFITKFQYALTIGSLMYTLVCMRPYIDHAMGVVNRFMSNSSTFHWEVVKWILRYLRCTTKKFVHWQRKNKSKKLC